MCPCVWRQGARLRACIASRAEGDSGRKEGEIFQPYLYCPGQASPVWARLQGKQEQIFLGTYCVLRTRSFPLITAQEAAALLWLPAPLLPRRKRSLAEVTQRVGAELALELRSLSLGQTSDSPGGAHCLPP